MEVHMYFLLLNIVSFLICGLVFGDNNGNSMPAYLLKLQELRKAATKIEKSSTETHLSSADNRRNVKIIDKKKPNRYKCVLMDEEDEMLLDEANESERSFVKVIPEHGDSATRKLHSPSFASEVQQKISEKEYMGNEEDEYIYVTSTTPLPTLSPITIKRLNSTGTRTISMSEPRDFAVSATQNPPAKQVRLPVAQGIPLKHSIPTSVNSVSDNLRHVGTPISTPQSSNLQQQQNRRRFMGSSTNQARPSNNNRQLVLNDEHCQMITQYAALYNVKDVKGWVHHNCAFAKMYLPNATCAEIDILVASCFH